MSFQRVERVPALPPRSREGHKGIYGKVLIIAGGRGMAGAAALCGSAALRSGAGLVQVACPAEVQPTVAGFEPCYMTCPLACGHDGLLLDQENRSVLEGLLPWADVVAVGPGLGRSVTLRGLVRWLLEACDSPMVLDADGLNALAGQSEPFARRSGDFVITPHPGEMSGLLGIPVPAVQNARQESALKMAASKTGLVVVLKGHGTVVAQGNALFVNHTGNSGMATGGSGDVLTGAIAALIGQGLVPFEASILGVHAHGLAGDLARDQKGEIGLIARDLLDHLPRALQISCGSTQETQRSR